MTIIATCEKRGHKQSLQAVKIAGFVAAFSYICPSLKN